MDPNSHAFTVIHFSLVNQVYFLMWWQLGPQLDESYLRIYLLLSRKFVEVVLVYQREPSAWEREWGPLVTCKSCDVLCIGKQRPRCSRAPLTQTTLHAGTWVLGPLPIWSSFTSLATAISAFSICLLLL